MIVTTELITSAVVGGFTFNMLKGVDLEDIARHAPLELRMWLAAWPETSAALLDDLSFDTLACVRLRVAQQKCNWPDIYRRLAKDDDAAIREEIARHKGLPGDVIFLLANDGDEAVRETIKSFYTAPEIKRAEEQWS